MPSFYFAGGVTFAGTIIKASLISLAYVFRVLLAIATKVGDASRKVDNN